jgi:hypothetical protein
MKQEKTILRKIAQNKESIKKFRNDPDIDPEAVKSVVFLYQELNRTLKWVLK